MPQVLDAKPGFIPRTGFADLLSLLQQNGYQCIGPRRQDSAIVYAPLTQVEDLPTGAQVSQRPGGYILIETDSPRWFAWSNGPQALKPLLFTATEPIWEASCDDEGALDFDTITPNVGPTAVIGVRPCDLAALSLLNQHFLEGDYYDVHFGARSRDLLLVAVNCSHPADTCFCASTGDGPGAVDGFDLLLDELDDGFVIRSGSERGQSILEQLSLAAADDDQLRLADNATAHAAESQQRSLPSRNLQHALFENLDHPRWKETANRCLACGNCTSVCPTCFCYRERDQAELDGASSVHLREWDSCFSQGHSYIFGKTIRLETQLRYRQWLTHKLGSWHEQYGRSGCVGCGRCISWCPVGIDITEEATAICGGADG